MEYKFRTLSAEEIECKIKTFFEAKGKQCAMLLLYKNARVDMDILDETVGADNWERDHKDVKGNLFCGIGIYNPETQRVTYKWDCGVESREDSEDNQKKGEASDSFKRAGFNWGIGRELYTAPKVYVTEKATGEFFKNKKGAMTTKTIFIVKEIDYKDKKITKLLIVDNEGKERFKYGYNK